MRFKAQAIGTSIGMSKNGTEQIAVRFRIDARDEDGKPCARHGDAVVWRGFFTDKTTDRTLESLHYCGMADDDIATVADLSEGECARLLPNYVEIVVEEEFFDGKTYEKVQWVNAIGEAREMNKTKADDRAVSALSARLKGRSTALRAAGQAKVKKGDLPF